MADEMVTAYKVTRPQVSPGTFCIYRTAGDMADAEFDGSEVGDKIEVEVVSMSRRDLDSLPDFAGW
jgi:hypothetical protein